LIDTAFVISENLPHRMVIKEMMMQMASPESCCVIKDSGKLDTL
jgi:hypothetical protein